MFTLDGKPLALDRAFSHDGVQYPRTWLHLASPQERAAIGIVEVADAPFYDQRFAWGYTEEGSLIWKDHEQLVKQWVSAVKATAGTLMAPTDWLITRASDPSSDKPVPEWALDERAAIRFKSDEKEAAIEATTSTEELAAYLTSSAFSSWSDPENIEAVGTGEDFFTFGAAVTGSAVFGGSGEDSIIL
jgi:hypothetical protein